MVGRRQVVTLRRRVEEEEPGDGVVALLHQAEMISFV